ncbi:MAG: choice-of-anchor Q domain-containing protein, partial [Planctomycetota bacterium]
SPRINNCTITGNTAGVGGGIYVHDGSPTITNCILWDNLSEQIHGYPSITYSDIQQQDEREWWDYEGCISADPCFVEPGYWDANDTPDDANDDFWIEGDHHLLRTSLCIDSGDPNYVAEPNETDLDGNPRVIGGRIDMGAYEAVIHEARLLILPRVINRKSKQPRIMARLRLPQGITKDQIDRDVPLILYPGGIEAMRQFVIPRRRQGTQRVSIFAFFNKAELMDSLDDNGRVELQILGQLRQPGQYFYGSDIIRIINRR